MSKPFIPRYSRWPCQRWLTKAFSGLSDRDKLGLCYLETGPHKHIEGIYLLPPEYACADLGWTLKNWLLALGALEVAGFIKWHAQSRTVFIVDALLCQAPENPNQADGAIRRILDLPASPLIQEFCAIAWDHSNRKGASKAFKQFVADLFKQTGTLLPEQTPALLPQQGPAQSGEQGRPLNLLPLTIAKPLTVFGKRPAGNQEKFRSEEAYTVSDQDQPTQIGDILKNLSPRNREFFSGHV